VGLPSIVLTDWNGDEQRRSCSKSRMRVGTSRAGAPAPQEWRGLILSGNRKGCDFGYAPAANSCEGANSPGACTIAAPDVITAFAVPNPSHSSQSLLVFSGPVARRVAP
jgi:hypothetical protein